MTGDLKKDCLQFFEELDRDRSSDLNVQVPGFSTWVTRGLNPPQKKGESVARIRESLERFMR